MCAGRTHARQHVLAGVEGQCCVLSRRVTVCDTRFYLAADVLLSVPCFRCSAHRLWRVITSNENTELQTILEEDPSRALLRAADGRGPLFWAHEASNEEAIELLKKHGAEEDAADADGKTCTNFEHGKMTEYMVKPKPSK